MAAKKKNTGLGKGLEALFGEVNGDTLSSQKRPAAKNVKKDENDPIYKMIVNMMEYNCIYCGTKWIVTQ